MVITTLFGYQLSCHQTLNRQQGNVGYRFIARHGVIEYRTRRIRHITAMALLQQNWDIANRLLIIYQNMNSSVIISRQITGEAHHVTIRILVRLNALN